MDLKPFVHLCRARSFDCAIIFSYLLYLSIDRSVSPTVADMSSPENAEPRERLLQTAYDLFTHSGVPTVGVDRIVAEAGVAKMTLYRHFRSKDELVVAALERREQVWTNDWLIREVERREATPKGRLLAMFDLFDEWFRREDYEGCFFTNSLIESHDRLSRIADESVRRLENVRAFVKGLAQEMGMADAEGFSRVWQLLMLGAITAAVRGDREAALRAKEIGLALLEGPYAA